jgi:hypothetical protein
LQGQGQRGLISGWRRHLTLGGMNRLADWRLFWLTRQVATRARPKPNLPTVAFFNASSRLTGMSLNAAFTLLTACGLQLAGVPVVYFVCRAGMSRCVLGTDRNDYAKPPPCAACIRQSQRLFAHALTLDFGYAQNPSLMQAVQGLSLEALSEMEWEDVRIAPCPIPLGRLVLPSLRWALRLHHLPDDEPTRALFREYLLSAAHVADAFSQFLDQVEPSVAVIFNGIMFPEAVARWVAQQKRVRVVTYEVGFQPFSAFFSDGEATAYPISIPPDFELNLEQNERLDAYLRQRFQGDFTMAGIRFWREMRALDEAFNRRAARFRRIVPVFTNVVYDTSQVHANTVFPHMFAWLDLILEIIRAHGDTLFVIRAHPDEMRPGTAKQSRESVASWIERNQVSELPNVIFVPPQEYLSSYELIQRSAFVMVYNSSIGLEAALMGVAVLCGGKARYTQYPIVFFPQSRQEYRQMAEQFLQHDSIPIPDEFQRNARRFLYYQLFRASLPFDAYLEEHTRPGYVRLKPFSWKSLRPENSPAVRVVLEGILHDKPFLLDES